MLRHAARNALLPVVTAFTLGIGYSFGGNVVIETVFSLARPGRDCSSRRCRRTTIRWLRAPSC